ncbi:metalloprotease [Humibacillus sp. DSM 29435]|uniref:protealysin inhibitor emfourin n=1 Tax=Humibacillus sp. DSM 29435 TaxID=1869167 RepID=UPI000872C5F6|nr:protealysin inhibitor emfourin [Humibacillus sp. DSM 29435]OFE14203.1 metalloprotease [Humibacillus sp. DSM 29435]
MPSTPNPSSPAVALCTIIPPYLLEALASSDEPRAAEHARASLAADRDLRALRRAPTRARRRPLPEQPGQTGPTRPGSDAPAAVSGPKRTISDAKGSQTTPGTKVRAEGGAPTRDPAADEAYDGLGATWTLWSAAYDRDSLDGKGMPLLATVHYGSNYDNAFWDGSQMVFGDGDGVIFERFTKSLDVIGHELAHGVTEHTAGLLYQGQSGALNESISDVFGSLVKQYHLGQSAADADWLIGAELLNPSVSGRALRDMLHPGTAYDDSRLGKDPQPADLAHYVQTTDDNGGVHINSGIPNRAFALAAVAIGGNAWGDAGAIWYAVLTGDGIKADCDFATFADLTVAAAAAAHGDGSAQHTAVRAAWTTVGVLSADGAGGSDGATPADPTTETPSGEAHGEVPGADTQVLLRRTGGFAGRVRERHLALGDLPESMTRDWQNLLGTPTLQRIAATADRALPDAYCYSVFCEPVNLDIKVAEPHLPESIHRLFERTLDLE